MALPKGSLLLLGAMAFVVFLAEGAVLDWSAVFLTDIRSLNPSTAALGYGSFALTMTVTRLMGDTVVDRLGRGRAITLGTSLATLGFATLTLAPTWQASLAGYVLLGLGCANIVPALLSLAGRHASMPPNLAVTSAATVGYLGILAGPAAIGLVAGHFGLIFAFLAVTLLLACTAFGSRWLLR